jgi:hypothetical protein
MSDQAMTREEVEELCRNLVTVGMITTAELLLETDAALREELAQVKARIAELERQP